MRLGYIHDHFPEDKIDRALKWLIDTGRIGIRFLQWVNDSNGCNGSDLNVHASLLSVVEKEKVLHIVAGKNFKL